MRKLAIITFLTLDGVMQAPGTPEEDPSGGFAHGGWWAAYWDDVMGQAIGQVVVTSRSTLRRCGDETRS